jgi:D-galactarolactone isomerase
MIERRAFIHAAIATAATVIFPLPDKAQEVPNSTGTGHPTLKAPARTCDCHMHNYDPDHFAFAPGPRVAPLQASITEYRLLQRRLGTTRLVVVTPRNYGIDNSATVDAVARYGADARGIAVLHPTVTDAELRMLDKAGIRGIRFSLGDSASEVVSPDMIEPLAKRVADFGWHLQLNVGGEQIVALAHVLSGLPTQIVFDHMARPPLPAGIAHPSHAVVRGLIDKRKAWIKLSGAYFNSKIGPPSYPEATAIARAFVKAAPERLVWGSDWPHPSVPNDRKPDDAILFDLLSEWIPDQTTRNRILVQNPETLYGFARSA